MRPVPEGVNAKVAVGRSDVRVTNVGVNVPLPVERGVTTSDPAIGPLALTVNTSGTYWIAADALIHDVMKPYKIGAGLIAVDAKGRIAAPYNTLGMARGWVGPDGVMHVGTHETMKSLALAS